MDSCGPVNMASRVRVIVTRGPVDLLCEHVNVEIIIFNSPVDMAQRRKSNKTTKENEVKT